MTRLFRYLSIAAAGMLLASNAFSQTSADLGSWCSMQIVKPLDKAYAMARFEHRSYDNISATECCFGMAGAGYAFTKWLKADLSYEYWKMPAAGNTVKQKAVLCVTGTLKRDALALILRDKFETAFSEGSGTPSYVFRSRLRGQYSLSKAPLTPYLMYEIFTGVGDAGWIRSLHYAGTEIRLADHHSLDLFYMYHLYPSGGQMKACNVLGAGYILTL